jgi:hypothetical protein
MRADIAQHAIIKRLVLSLSFNLALLGYLATFQPDAWWWRSGDYLNRPDLMVRIAQYFQFIGLAYFLVKLTWFAHARAQLNKAGQNPVPRLALQILAIVIYATLLVAGLSFVFDVPLETFWAASGLLTLVVGLALRGLVSDLFSGIALSLDQSIQPGDWLEFNRRGSSEKTVACFLYYRWRLSCLVDTDGIATLIPNGEFAQLAVVNLTRPTEVTWHKALVELDSDVDHERVTSILQNAASKAVSDRVINASPSPLVRLSGLENGAVTFMISFTLAPCKSPTTPIHQILQNSLKFLKMAGISVTRVAHHSNEVSSVEQVLLAPIEERAAEARADKMAVLPFFFFLSREELVTMSKTTKICKIAQGTPIIKVGEPGDSMFLVTEGSFQVFIEINGEQKVVATIWPGEFFGEMSLFTGAPRSATIISASHSVVLEISKPTVARLFDYNPSFAKIIADTIDGRVAANAAKMNEANGAPIEAEQRPSILSALKAFFKLTFS